MILVFSSLICFTPQGFHASRKTILTVLGGGIQPARRFEHLYKHVPKFSSAVFAHGVPGRWGIDW
jgi:hypothetical protein